MKHTWQNTRFFGAAVGRYGNRIKNGKMEIDGKKYQLAINMGTDHIHGGISGFDKKVWDVISFDQQKNILELSTKSPDGEEGYPGNLDVTIKFELNENNELSHEYTATTDQLPRLILRIMVISILIMVKDVWMIIL